MTGSDGVRLATVTITKTLDADDVVVDVEAVTPDGGTVPLVDALGMIELAKDSLLRVPYDDGEDDEP